jgi:hypothetical protein
MRWSIALCVAFLRVAICRRWRIIKHACYGCYVHASGRALHWISKDVFLRYWSGMHVRPAMLSQVLLHLHSPRVSMTELLC